MRASPAGAAMRFYNGDGLTVIEQSLQRACQLLELVVRQLGQAVDQARHLLLSHGLLLGQTLGAVMLAGIFSLWSSPHGRVETVALAWAAAFAMLAAVSSALRLRTQG